jgi:hypothetical protein
MNQRPDVVPRRMLELCRDLLRECLARGVALQRQLEASESEVARLRRRLREWRES